VLTIKQQIFNALIFYCYPNLFFISGRVMATKRIPIRQLREILRLRLHAKLSQRQIRNRLKLSLGSIQKTISKAKELNLTWGSD